MDNRLTNTLIVGETVPARLRLLAEWVSLKTPNNPDTEVQDDLRRWATQWEQREQHITELEAGIRAFFADASEWITVVHEADRVDEIITVDSVLAQHLRKLVTP